MKVRELSYRKPLHAGFSTGTWTSNLVYYKTSLATFMAIFNGVYPTVSKVWVPSVTNFPIQGKFGSQKFDSTLRKKPIFNDCFNQKVTARAVPITGFIPSGTKNYWYGYWKTIPPLSIKLVDADMTVDGHPPINLHNAQVTAWHTMQPRFEGDISLFNFIYELKDMKSLLRLMGNKPLSKLGSKFRRIKKKGRIDPTKPLAQSYLGVEFALKPLLSDLFTIGCQIEDIVAEAQQDFADSGRELQSRHYSETFTHTKVDGRSRSAKTSNPYMPQGYCHETKFVATMEYSYRYNMRSTIDAFMRYWGLQSSREAIWNAIPFSFVADYVINLGDCIRLTDHDENVGLELSQYCESLVTSKSTGLFIDTTKSYDGIYGDSIGTYHPTSLGTMIAGVESSLYTRRRCNPNYGILIPRIRMPSSSQDLTMAALLRAFF